MASKDSFDAFISILRDKIDAFSENASQPNVKIIQNELKDKALCVFLRLFVNYCPGRLQMQVGLGEEERQSMDATLNPTCSYDSSLTECCLL